MSKKCCKFHNRLDLKFPDEEYDFETRECGMAGYWESPEDEHRVCCKNCPELNFKVGIIIKKK